MLFLDPDDVEPIVRGHLRPEVADAVLARTMLAIGLRVANEETSSWLRGPSAYLLPEAAWPSFDGRALQPTARIALDGLPVVVDEQPGRGFLSFFDGYPWGEHADWVLEPYGQVLFDDGQGLEERACPLPTDGEVVDGEELYYYGDPRQFVVAEGPYATVPHHEYLYRLDEGGDPDAVKAFFDAVFEARVRGHFVGQLFGRPSPIQTEITPEHRNDRNDQPFDPDAWIHLASFVAENFEYYFATRYRSLADRRFDEVIFDAQCS